MIEGERLKVSQVKKMRHISSPLQESPQPVDPSMFPTWPAKSEKMRRKSREKSPTPPMGGHYLLNQVLVQVYTYYPVFGIYPEQQQVYNNYYCDRTINLDVQLVAQRNV